MTSQTTANVTVRLTKEQHFALKYLALRRGTTMKKLLSEAIETLVRKRWVGDHVEYEPGRRDTNGVLLVVDPTWATFARQQAEADNVFYTTLYTTAALSILKETDNEESSIWH